MHSAYYSYITLTAQWPIPRRNTRYVRDFWRRYDVPGSRFLFSQKQKAMRDSYAVSRLIISVYDIEASPRVIPNSICFISRYLRDFAFAIDPEKRHWSVVSWSWPSWYTCRATTSSGCDVTVKDMDFSVSVEKQVIS